MSRRVSPTSKDTLDISKNHTSRGRREEKNLRTFPEVASACLKSLIPRNTTTRNLTTSLLLHEILTFALLRRRMIVSFTSYRLSAVRKGGWIIRLAYLYENNTSRSKRTVWKNDRTVRHRRPISHLCRHLQTDGSLSRYTRKMIKSAPHIIFRELIIF